MSEEAVAAMAKSSRINAAYTRVSSRAQNLATQRNSVVRKADAFGDEIGEWFSEKRGGETMKRPELERMRQVAREGRIRRLYVFRIDRLTRSGIRDTFGLIEELRHNSCEIVSVADGFDLNGPAAEVVLAVMAWSAKMERLAINERIAAARERLESEGRSWGRLPRMSALEIENAAALRAMGRTWRSISMALKVPKSTVQRAVAASQKLARNSDTENTDCNEPGADQQGEAQ